MTTEYRFQTTARWTQGRRGIAEGEPHAPPLPFSAPPQFAGEAGVWTPEHFLLAAVSSCFITTFRAIAELSRLQTAALEVSVEGTVSKAEGGFRFTEILLKPRLTVEREEDRERGLRLLEKAEHSCLVSRSLLSEIRMEPSVQVTTAALVS